MLSSLYSGRRSWNQEKSPDRGCLVLAILLIFLGVAMFFNGGLEVKSDGSNYFAYLRSAVFDRDLDFQNEFSHYDKAFWDTYKPKQTVTGHYTNVFSVGPAVLWAPFYLAAHLFVIVANLLGAGLKPDGFGPPYLAAISLGSLLYSFAATCMVYKLCRHYFGRWPSFIATATVWLATFITYYVIYQPYMSHAVSFFTVTLFIYYWHTTREGRTSFQWALLGVIAGLMMTVRWQNGLMMIIPACESLGWYALAVFSRNWQSVRSLLKNNTIFLISVLAGFFPQMAAWKIIYGSFLTVPQGSGFLRWDAPFIWEVLFSSRHGLFSWSPVVYIAAVGWLLFFKRDRLLSLSVTIAFFLMLYMNSIIADWWAGWGFGMRRFDSFILLFALGLGEVLQRLKKVQPAAALAAGLCITLLFSTFNWHLMKLVDNRTIHPGGPVAFNRVLGLADSGIYHWTGYPFSFPANYVFAIRYRLSPARYDTLVGGYVDDPNFYGNTIQPAKAEVLLGTGWSAPYSHNGIEVRSVRQKALVYAPVRTVTDFALTITAIGKNIAPAGIVILLNNREVGILKPANKLTPYSLKLEQKNLNPGINIIELKNNGNSGELLVQSMKFERLENIPDWR